MIKSSFFIAKRYLFTFKSKNIVNIVSFISLFGVSICTACLIIVLSVFNGFENIILNMYTSFDPHLKIMSLDSKTFSPENIQTILEDENQIQYYSSILEEKVLLGYQGKEYISIMKGVDTNFSKIVDIENILKYGEFFEEKQYRNSDVAVLGAGVSHNLSVDIYNLFGKINITVPERQSKYIKDSTDLIRKIFTPLGIFSVQADYDNQYFLVPLVSAQRILNRKNQVSSIEIKLVDPDNMIEIKDRLQKNIGSKYIILTQLEQHSFLYKLLNSEKLAVFIILTFILIIASFNVISSLAMMMIQKRKDIKSLWYLGASRKHVHTIFFIKGMLGIIIGSILGLCLGLVFSYLQSKYGFIKVEGNFVLDAYPIKINLIDILYVEIVVLLIGLFTTYYPARFYSKKILKST